jgi:DNA-binding transcriptional LysR family regulator
LFDIEIDAGKSYFLVCRPEQAASRKVRVFRDWIASEIDWESR